MLAEQLFALAAARGIDLSSVGGTSTKTDGDAARRRRTKEERRLGLEVVESALGRGSRSYRRPTWSHADLGHAAQHMDELHWLAACYSYAGDRSAYWRLWEALMYQAGKLAQREGWRPQVMGRAPIESKCTRAPDVICPLPTPRPAPKFYRSELCTLVLDEEAYPAIFAAAPAMYPVYLEVDDLTWARVLEPRFWLLKSRYGAWLASAREVIRRRCNRDRHEEERA